MKTSYVANLRAVRAAGLVPVLIARFPPDGYVGRICMPLAPSRANFKLQDDEFDRAFAHQLAALDAQAVYDELLLLTDGLEPCLLCFEHRSARCHRQNVAIWFKQTLNLDVSEL